jgi:hypothetical protein
VTGALSKSWAAASSSAVTRVLDNASPCFANNAQAQWVWQQADGLPVNVTRGFGPASISSGFQAGVNTLEFQVQDAGGISAFHAELSGTAQLVPEPGTLAFVALGLFAAAAGLAGRPG